jgi:hypothetical protein
MATKSVDSGSQVPTANTTAVDILLQWLTYALWTLGVLAMAAVLATNATYYFIVRVDDYSFMLFLLAAVIILVPAAAVVDYLYRQREQMQKRGFSAVVMVTHAVGVSLLWVVALIVALLFLLQLWVNGSPTPPHEIALTSALIVLVLNALLFMRILDVSKLQPVRKYFPWIMSALAILAIAVGVAGPIRHTVATKSDRIVDSGLPTIDTAIEDYVTSYSKFPPNLSALQTDSASLSDLNPDGTNLIKKHAITYVPGAVIPEASGSTSGPTLYYQLCVSYTHASGSPVPAVAGETALTNATHKSGHVCYHLNSNGT